MTETFTAALHCLTRPYGLCGPFCRRTLRKNTIFFTLRLMVDALEMEPEQKTFPRSLVEAEHARVPQRVPRDHLALLRASPTTDRNQNITARPASLTWYENIDGLLAMYRFSKRPVTWLLPNAYHLSKGKLKLQGSKRTKFDKEVGKWTSKTHESRCGSRIQRLTR